jgi:membrane-associated phospholipid phosphatase
MTPVQRQIVRPSKDRLSNKQPRQTIFQGVREQLAMDIRFIAPKQGDAPVATRTSPISRSASFLMLGLATIGLTSSIATQFNLASLPNIVLLVVGIVVLDVLSQFVPQTRMVTAVQTILYGVLYLATTCVYGILAAYALQRFAFPLQDHLLTSTDQALGLSWSDYAHWVDRHPSIQTILQFAYNTIFPQIALPLVVLALSHQFTEIRIYFVAMAIAFVATIIIAALLPAAGPVAFVDRASFEILRFTGATPFDHLMRLREAGPLVMTDPPGGIGTFPSFHATVAVMTPLILRHHRRIFFPLLVLNAAMLAGTVTEGAHYFSDVLAGICMAFLAHALATWIIGIEDRTLSRRANGAVPGEPAVQAA